MSHSWTAALPDRIGVNHTSGRYKVGPEEHLLAGALRTLELGSRVLKLWFRMPVSEFYPGTTGWPASIRTLTDLAQAAPMREIFALPFTTIFLSCDALGLPNTWAVPQTPAQLAEEAAQLEDLTRYLLRAYADRDPTFVVTNWESDWAVRGGFDKDEAPTRAALDGMIARFDNRQSAIERGRSEVVSRARVLQAGEVNLVFGGGHPALAVTRAVLPDTRLDLYAYSAYESTCFDEGTRFVEALELLRDHTAPSEAFGRDNICIGEFGAQEVWLGKDEAAAITRGALATALEFGCPYVLYWEIFDNEKLAEPIDGADYPGFWVLRPDGSRSVQGDILAEYLKGGAR